MARSLPRTCPRCGSLNRQVERFQYPWGFRRWGVAPLDDVHIPLYASWVWLASCEDCGARVWYAPRLRGALRGQVVRWLERRLRQADA